MPTNPDNERYQHDFSRGEGNWASGDANRDGYSDLFNYLERDVPITAEEAELTNYRPLPGRRFVASDTENEYISDGKEWNQLTSRGKNPKFESSHSEELLLNQYASADSAPAGSGVGIIGVTDDGHILVEDGQ